MSTKYKKVISKGGQSMESLNTTIDTPVEGQIKKNNPSSRKTRSILENNKPKITKEESLTPIVTKKISMASNKQDSSKVADTSAIIGSSATTQPAKKSSSIKSSNYNKTQTELAPYTPKENEEYMNENQLAHFYDKLIAWREQLDAARVAATSQHMGDDRNNLPDFLDRATVEEEHTLEWRAREREHRLTAKINERLASIQLGDYGYCQKCGGEIGIGRLEAYPTATQCIECKIIAEIREKQTGTVE